MICVVNILLVSVFSCLTVLVNLLILTSSDKPEGQSKTVILNMYLMLNMSFCLMLINIQNTNLLSGACQCTTTIPCLSVLSDVTQILLFQIGQLFVTA